MSIAHRLRDVLLLVRRKYGMEPVIDRLLPYLTQEQDISGDRFSQLLPTCEVRVPADHRAATIARIREVVQDYWGFRKLGKGRHKVLGGIRFLKALAEARHGFEGYSFEHDETTGYRLIATPNHPDHRK